MTTLPERLRASAQSLRASVRTSTPAVLVHPHTFHRIASELEEAAQALEAGPWMPIETAPKETEVLVWFGPVVGVKSATYTELFGDAVWFWCVTDGKFNPHPVRRYCAPYPTHWMPLPPPPSAQVAQEGGNTPYDEGPFTIEGGGVATAGALPDPKLCPRCCQYHGPVCPAGVPAKWSPCDECTTRPACARMAACIEEPRHG